MKDKSAIFEDIIFILSIYVLIELLLEFILEFPPLLLQVVAVVDFIICMVFLADWTYYFIKAEKKSAYFLGHMFDLVSAIPFIPGLRFLRVFRIFRFVRGFRGMVSLFKAFRKKPMESALAFYLVCLVLIFGYCSLAYYRYEVGVNPDMPSFSDAAWLAFTTLSSTGFGRVHPVTSNGKIVSSILVITGAGFFALLSGEFATLLIKAYQDQENEKELE